MFYNFSSREFNKKGLNFQYNKLDNREWLAYYKEMDGMTICKYCAKFIKYYVGKGSIQNIKSQLGRSFIKYNDFIEYRLSSIF